MGAWGLHPILLAHLCQTRPVGDLTPGSGRRLSRRNREQRAYALVLVGGVAGVVAVVGVLLAIVGVIGAGLPLLAAVVAAVCFLLFRRTVGR
jgi:hypothetical protein